MIIQYTFWAVVYAIWTVYVGDKFCLSNSY
jgi:hypothetical protein